ncbi:MAG TPA: PQQ-dependent sugar dehydrogenase [Verrucomicrobiae bacterium]|jgi:glucose/arabinose dehydrogenase|nr:PQQ-dependent sugar dehydrogenase [Verrucomicrobiae bacterium]
MKKFIQLSGIVWLWVLGAMAAAANPLPHVKLTSLFPAAQLANPVWMCQAPGDPGRFFLVEQAGRILITPKGGDGSQTSEFLNITDRHPFFGYEDGLLSIAFHPDFQSNHLAYIYYTQENTNHSLYPYRSVISELKLAADDTNRLDLASERILLEVPQPFQNHKGGLLLFGPDGYLYLGLGDGGMGDDPFNNGQNTASLLGKFLRIDVNKHDPSPEKNKPPLPYGIPSDNPFVHEPYYGGAGSRHEVYAWGMRNPWRYSFDRQTGELWAGDVGQDLWEEVDLIVKGGNYGWCAREGAHYFKPAPEGARYNEPVIEYPHRPDLLAKSQFPKHAPGMCVTGGYVYRGQKYPALQGVYVYADFALGTIFGLRYQDHKLVDYGTLLEQPKNIDSFAEDLDGELYAIALDGHIFSISVKE